MNDRRKKLDGLPQTFTPGQMPANAPMYSGEKKSGGGMAFFIWLALAVLIIGGVVIFCIYNSSSKPTDKSKDEKTAAKNTKSSGSEDDEDITPVKKTAPKLAGIDAKGATDPFDKDGRILYKNRYYTVDELKNIPEAASELFEYKGEDPKYKNKTNTRQNWLALGMVDLNGEFKTKQDLINNGFGYAKSQDRWDKTDNLKNNGFVLCTKDNNWYTEEEMQKMGYCLINDKWLSPEEMQKLEYVQLGKGGWEMKKELVAKNYFHDTTDDKWYSPDEMKEKGFVFFNNTWKKKEDWLADDSVAVTPEGEVMSKEDAEKNGLKKLKTGEYVPEKEWYEANGYKDLDGKWVTAEQYDKAMAKRSEAERAAEAKKIYDEAIKIKAKDPLQCIKKLEEVKEKFSDTTYYKDRKGTIEGYIKQANDAIKQEQARKEAEIAKKQEEQQAKQRQQEQARLWQQQQQQQQQQPHGGGGGGVPLGRPGVERGGFHH